MRCFSRMCGRGTTACIPNSRGLHKATELHDDNEEKGEEEEHAEAPRPSKRARGAATTVTHITDRLALR